MAKKKIELRPYQREAKVKILEAWDHGYRRVLLVLPTGCGKTIVFASVIGDMVKRGHRVLVIAHREELLSQAKAKIKAAVGLDSALEKGKSHALGSELKITVASIASLSNDARLSKHPHDYYDCIVVDEAHHCLAPTYRKILKYFGKAYVLGVTATPDRGDMQNLGKFFDKKAYEYTLEQAIREGYLSPIKAKMIPLKLDISKVSVTTGDYDSGQLGNAIEPYLEAVAAQMKKHCKTRRSVVFLPLVRTSKKLCAILNRIGFKAVQIDGQTKNRAEVLADFEAGKYNVICNSMLLTEGWDCPRVNCIIVLRPTRSRSLYQQMVGRGMRLAPRKKNLLLLDFLWHTEKFDLCKPSSLISRDEVIAKKVDEMLAKMMVEGEELDLIEAETKVEEEIIAAREASLAKELAAMRLKRGQTVDVIRFALAIGAESILNYAPAFAWEKDPPTERQLERLQKAGIEIDGITSKGQANVIIEMLGYRTRAGLSTPKQISNLERKGFRRVGLWTKAEAGEMLSEIQDNGWRVPYWIDPETYAPERIQSSKT